MTPHLTDEPLAAGKRQRAAPMPPEDRRTAIIAAIIPLVRKHGFDVTTRQIAAAADIAEGTIFRVFSDKETLVHEAIAAALDPSEDEAMLDAIDLRAPLHLRIELAAQIFQERMTSMIELVTAIGRINFPERDAEARHAQHRRMLDMVANLFEPDRDQLRCEPAEAARLLQALAFGGSHPRMAGGRVMTPDEIADLLLNGIRRHETT